MVSSKISQELKQKIAREFNYSETVFLHDASSGERLLEIFTPTTELNLAGHPIIGTLNWLQEERVTLRTKAGPVYGRYNRSDNKAEAEIPQAFHTHEAPAHSKDFLNTQIDSRNVPIVSIVKGMTFALVELPELTALEALRASKPYDNNVVKLDAGWTPSFVGSYYYVLLQHSSNDQPTKLRARMFSPSAEEDSCTGSAACSLASWLALRYGGANAIYHFIVQQGFEMGRAGDLHVTVGLDTEGASILSVVLGGQAVVSMRGSIVS